jgi:DNA-binding transcriptional ArsR family regulator
MLLIGARLKVAGDVGGHRPFGVKTGAPYSSEAKTDPPGRRLSSRRDFRSTERLTSGRAGHNFNRMVELNALDNVFHALADGTRRAMLRSLADGERNIGQLAEPFAMSFAAASKHVKVLEGAGLLRRRVQGRNHVCSIETAPLATAGEWLRFYEGFWTDRLDGLDQLLRNEDEAAAKGEETP